LISQQNIDENERPTMELHPVLQALKPVIKGMALAMGPDYEIVLHDIADPDNSIIAIENSHVTGRKIGDSLTDYAMYLLKTSDQKKKDFVANFLTRTKEGKRIRSSTLYLRDEDGRLIGYLCINYDMSKAEIIRNMVEQLVNVTGGTEAIPREEEMPSTLEGLMERNLKLIRRLVGKPLHMSSKQEKLQAIKVLDDEGFFMLKGAVEALAEETGNTKYTIYSYLREVRGERSETPSELR
jgi:predicted transcriptional regulator YheO